MNQKISQSLITYIKTTALLVSSLLFISCGNIFKSKNLCQSIKHEMKDLQACLSLSDSEYKIDLKGRMSTEMDDVISQSDVKDLESITQLDLSDNPDLTNLPDFVYHLSHLAELDISNTKISHWDKKICQLKKLNKLIGTHNNYENGEIPFHTFCIQNLEILDMSHSNIKYLDEYIGKLQKLKTLRLRNNQLTIVPLMMQQLPEISLIDFKNNFFKDEKINSLHNCAFITPASKKECREEMLETMSGLFYYEVPFLRGEPLRKIYTDLAGVDLDDFESVDAEIPLNRDRCYNNWLAWMIDYEESPELLEKTIRGKTIRELRYRSPYQEEHVNRWWSYSIDWPFFTNDYEPKKIEAQPHEIWPEKFLDPGMATQFSALLKEDEYYWVPDEKECPHLVNLIEHVKRKQKRIQEKNNQG